MPNLAIIGGQWGDEGKGKVVDLLAPRFDVVARYQGGPNAGHTVVFDGQRHALHHIPSGIFHDGVVSAIGAGSVVDPIKLLEEIEGLRGHGVPVETRLKLCRRAHVILPWHRDLDGALEARAGERAIGTTKRGIGPAYAAKAQRWGLRVGDLCDAQAVRERTQRMLNAGIGDWLDLLGQPRPEPEAVGEQCEAWSKQLAPFVTDVTQLMHASIRDSSRILFEGAQGALLDVDHGSYPFVTSSNTTTAGIPAGLGVPPRAVERTIGVFKAYLTRVGSGPFVSEEHGEVGDRLRKQGHEFGTTTGRPRRCGWFDAVGARFAVRLNGLDELAVTKFDVLSGVDPIRLCVGYEIDGERTDQFPSALDDSVEPIYENWPGWSEPIENARQLEDLPKNARAVLDRMAELCECPVGLVSVGPDRTQTIIPPHGLLGGDDMGTLDKAAS